MDKDEEIEKLKQEAKGLRSFTYSLARRINALEDKLDEAKIGKPCTVEGCDRPAYFLGWPDGKTCKIHGPWPG